jgi:branched-chain amino acid transport system substrate-binding protein
VQAILHIAEEEINQEGLGGNARLEILIKDDGADPNQSVLVVRQMINTDNVAAILGPLNSGPARVTVPLGKQTQTPFIEPSAAVPGLLEPARPWAVRIALINEQANWALWRMA